MKILLYSTAIALGIVGWISFIYAPPHSMLKLLSMAIVATSAFLLSRIGKKKTLHLREYDKTEVINSQKSRKLDAFARYLGLAAFFSVIISSLFLRNDALNGGHQAWPAYAFAISILFAAIIWSYLFAKSIFKRKDE